MESKKVQGEHEKMTKGVNRLHNFAYVRNMPMKIHHTVHTIYIPVLVHTTVLNSSRCDQPSSTVSDAISSGLYIFACWHIWKKKWYFVTKIVLT